MKLIAHRGNLNGSSRLENHPCHVIKALKEGFEAEIDVWYEEKEIWLGHNEPTYQVSLDFIFKEGLWCHAKSIEALDYMLNFKQINCFWHEEDAYTLTSHGWIWAYPEELGGKRVITVMPELAETPYEIQGYYGGVCTDNIISYLD